MRASILLLLLLVVSSTPVPGQMARVRTGARVRVATEQPERRLAIGTVESLDADSMVVDRGGGERLRLAVNDITALEVYRRGKGAETSGKVVGTISAAGGAALYINWCLKHVTQCQYLESDGDEDDNEDDNEDDDEGEEGDFSMGALVTLSFAAIGYAIGYSIAPQRWEVVNLPIRIGVAPMRRGVGVYVSLPAPRFMRSGR